VRCFHSPRPFSCRSLCWSSFTFERGVGATATARCRCLVLWSVDKEVSH
jgi:hypothetical protein